MPPQLYIYPPLLPLLPTPLSAFSASPMASHHILLFLLFIHHCAEAQTTSPKNLSSSFNSSMAIIIALLVTAFFFLSFFSIYIRHCGNQQNSAFAAAAAISRIRIQQGLDPQLLQKFPTLVYSQVKEHKIGKGALECAICINEFDDEETIRLLPQCDHAFHVECIDAWLASHVTCPVCRTNYALCSPDQVFQLEKDLAADAPPAQHVAITVEDLDERKEEMRAIARIATKVRGRKSKRLSKSHSTGHSMDLQGEGNFDRYTLRLPEKLREEIMAGGKMKRASTFAVTVSVGGAGEASMRKVSRGVGEESGRTSRTIRLGDRSDRWPSFFGRSMSSKISTFANWRKGEEVNDRELKLSGGKTAVESRGGGSSNGGGDNYSFEASTAPLNRV